VIFASAAPGFVGQAQGGPEPPHTHTDPAVGMIVA